MCIFDQMFFIRNTQCIWIKLLFVTKFFISGRIVNVSSVAGLYGYPGLSTYCATKHAIEAVSSVLRHELVKFDISVVTVQPGDFSKATHLLGTDLELLSKELNHFGVIADLFRQIGGHSSRFVLFCSFWRLFTIKMIKSVKVFPFSFWKIITQRPFFTS